MKGKAMAEVVDVERPLAPPPASDANESEWRRNWKLVLAAMLGYSAVGLQHHGFGPFVPYIRQEFGWSLSQVMMGLSLAAFIGMFLATFTGMAVDRFGPRRVGLAGLLFITGAFVLLGTATGTTGNWLLLWSVVSIGMVLVQPTAWSSAVAVRFDKSRGLAMAIAISGSTVTATIAPLIATPIAQAHGWRVGLASIGILWFFLTVPPVYLYFGRDRVGLVSPSVRRAVSSAPAPPPLTGLTFREGIRTRAFAGLLVSFACFTFYGTIMAPNLVSVLKEQGLEPMTAAWVASSMGVAGFVARLSVGALLDRFAGNVIGCATQLLPVAGCVVFLLPDPGLVAMTLAVITFGIATGAEMDVALYLATRHFGMRAFAALFGAIMTVGAATSAAAPLVAGGLSDATGSYDAVFALLAVVLTIGAVGMLSVGRPRGSTT